MYILKKKKRHLGHLLVATCCDSFHHVFLLHSKSDPFCNQDGCSDSTGKGGKLSQNFNRLQSQICHVSILELCFILRVPDDFERPLVVEARQEFDSWFLLKTYRKNKDPPKGWKKSLPFQGIYIEKEELCPMSLLKDRTIAFKSVFFWEDHLSHNMTWNQTLVSKEGFFQAFYKTLVSKTEFYFSNQGQVKKNEDSLAARRLLKRTLKKFAWKAWSWLKSTTVLWFSHWPWTKNTLGVQHHGET